MQPVSSVLFPLILILLTAMTDFAAVLDFETVNGEVPFKGMAISNQFAGTFGMRFTSLDGAYYPTIIEVGRPGYIFLSPHGYDTILATSPDQVGEFFLADLTSNLESGPKGFFVRFDAPVSKFNFDVLDLDGKETLTVKAYASESPLMVIATNIYSATNTAVFGDSIAVPVGISANSARITAVSVSTLGSVGFDNFVTDYTPAPQQAAQIDFAMVPGIRLTGSIGTPYRIDYSEDSVTWQPLSTNYLTATNQWFFDKTLPLPRNRTYRAVGVQ